MSMDVVAARTLELTRTHRSLLFAHRHRRPRAVVHAVARRVTVDHEWRPEPLCSESSGSRFGRTAQLVSRSFELLFLVPSRRFGRKVARAAFERRLVKFAIMSSWISPNELYTRIRKYLVERPYSSEPAYRFRRSSITSKVGTLSPIS